MHKDAINKLSQPHTSTNTIISALLDLVEGEKYQKKVLFLHKDVDKIAKC